MIGTKIGHLWCERFCSCSAGRHQPSSVVTTTRSAPATARSTTAPRQVESAEVPISGYGTPLSSVTLVMTIT